MNLKQGISNEELIHTNEKKSLFLVQNLMFFISTLRLYFLGTLLHF